MLPKVVWEMPSLGTFNLHASLLPNYRGAAPINWAINGETETGVTTFFITKDTGAMILNATITINQEENAGQLHDRLMQLGSETVIKTLTLIEEDNISLTNQTENPDIKLHINSIKKIAKSTGRCQSCNT
jgi:methionyl-tRNA formyltransferase